MSWLDLEITPETVGGAGVTKEIGLLDGNERTDIAISRAQTGDIFSKGDQDLGEGATVLSYNNFKRIVFSFIEYHYKME